MHINDVLIEYDHICSSNFFNPSSAKTLRTQAIECL